MVGLISDTHGLLRDEAIRALQGVDLILHAGDVGAPDIVEQLSRIAPVHAILGNVDHGDWLPSMRTVEIGNCRVLLLHNIADLPGTAGVDAVVYGHSHKPLVEMRHEVLFVNPGSAGRRRFKLPVTVGRMIVDGGRMTAEIIHIAK